MGLASAALDQICVYQRVSNGVQLFCLGGRRRVLTIEACPGGLTVTRSQKRSSACTRATLRWVLSMQFSMHTTCRKERWERGRQSFASDRDGLSATNSVPHGLVRRAFSIFDRFESVSFSRTKLIDYVASI